MSASKSLPDPWPLGCQSVDLAWRTASTAPPESSSLAALTLYQVRKSLFRSSSGSGRVSKNNFVFTVRTRYAVTATPEIEHTVAVNSQGRLLRCSQLAIVAARVAGNVTGAATA